MSISIDDDLYQVLHEHFEKGERSDYVNYQIRKRLLPKTKSKENIIEKMIKSHENSHKSRLKQILTKNDNF
jgi:hypothetical protein